MEATPNSFIQTVGESPTSVLLDGDSESRYCNETPTKPQTEHHIVFRKIMTRKRALRLSPFTSPAKQNRSPVKKHEAKNML